MNGLKADKKALDVSSISWKEINELYQRADPTDWQFKFRKGEIIPKKFHRLGTRPKKYR